MDYAIIAILKTTIPSLNFVSSKTIVPRTTLSIFSMFKLHSLVAFMSITDTDISHAGCNVCKQNFSSNCAQVHLLLNNADIDIQCITYWIVSWNYSYSFLSHKCSILTDHSHRTEFTQRVLVFIYILVCARHLAFKPNFHWSICSAVCYFYNYRSDVTSNVYLIQNLLTRRDDACTFIFISINNFIYTYLQPHRRQR